MAIKRKGHGHRKSATLGHRHGYRPSTTKCKASIVAQNGYLGGRPRLAGHRLDVEWFAANRDNPPQWWSEHYSDLGLEAILFMFAVVDAVEKGLASARSNG